MDSGAQCESPIKEVVEGVGSGQVSLHMKASSLASPGTGSLQDQQNLS